MNRFASLLFAGSLAVFAQTPGAAGQSAQPRQTGQSSDTLPGATGSTTSGSGQTITGILMDASCQAIANRGTASGRAMRSWSGSSTESARGTDTARTTPSDPTSPAQEERRSTREGAQTGATSGASSASAQGTTGAAPTSPEPNSPTTSAAETGERSRSVEQTVSTTVREKYRDCMATTDTSAFAIHADGKLYVFDQTGNDMIRKQMGGEAFRAAMANESGAPKWTTATVQGTANGDTLTITSVRK